MPWNAHLPKAEFYRANDPMIESVVRAVRDEPIVAIDTETTGLIVWKCMPLFFSLSWGNRRVCLEADALHHFQESFNDYEKEWVFANAKFDMHMLSNTGFRFNGKVIDTQVMHALLYEECPHSLDFMGQQILKWQWKDMFEGWDRRAMPEVGDFIKQLFVTDPQKLIEYASNDAYGTMRIYQKLKQELEDAPVHSLYPKLYATLWDIFKKIEVPFTKTLWKCEHNGILVDETYLSDLSIRCGKELGDIERALTAEVGGPLNPNSPLQMREYFVEKMNLRPLSYSKGGKSGVKQPQVDWAYLDHYKNDCLAAKLCLEHRDLSKLKGTYADGLRDHFDAKSRIHTRFNQNIARTGRLSSSDPNLQNIPNPDQDKHQIRKAFISGPRNDLIVYDYSALEMRLLACASMEPVLIQAFKENLDPHAFNASKTLDIPYDDIVAAKEKKEAKLPLTDYEKRCIRARGDMKATVGFGVLYGMGAKSLAGRLGVDEPAAQQIIDQFMDRNPSVKIFMDEAINDARETGYAFTILGRRRFLPEIISDDRGVRQRAERQAGNMPIQGSAADAAKMAMILIDDLQLDKQYGCQMLLQVHDELVFECPKETRAQVMPIIKEWMEHPFHTDLAVELKVSGGFGSNWAEAK